MTLVELPRVVPAPPGRFEWGDAKREMNELTRTLATEPDAWTPERAAQIAAFFDGMATGWQDRDTPERHDAIRDALARGGPFPSGLCIEVGSGTGNATSDFVGAFTDVVSLDISHEMLRHARTNRRQVQSDAAALPLRMHSAAVVTLINMFVFPAEVARVLRNDGVLLWVSTNGEETPIYLPPAEVLAALPGSWTGVTAEAGWGIWLTARRAA